MQLSYLITAYGASYLVITVALPILWQQLAFVFQYEEQITNNIHFANNVERNYSSYMYTA